MEYNKFCFSSHIIFQIYTTYMNSAETLGPKYSIVSLLTNTKYMVIPMPISFSGAKINTFVKKNCAFGIIRKLDVNQYIFPYTFNQTSAMTCELLCQPLFLKGLSLH